MATLGELLKQQDPEKYGATPAEVINQNIAAHLADPARRQAALNTLRRRFKSVANDDDETLTAKALRGVGASPQQPVDPEAQRQRASAATQRRMIQTSQKLRTGVRQNERAIERGDQPYSAAVDRQLRAARVEIPTPQSTRLEVDPVDQEGAAGTSVRAPVVDDFRELAALAKKEGLKLTLPGHGFGLQVIATDPSGNIRYALNPQASFDPKMVEGASVAGYFTGTSDPLQGAAASALAQATGLDKDSSLGTRAGSGTRAGYGMRELGGDVGERVAQRIPGNVGSKATAAALGAGYGLMGGWNRGQAAATEGAASALQRLGKAVGSDWLADTPVLNRMAAEDRQEASEAAARAQDLENFRRTVDELPQDEVAKLGGRYAGYSVGEGGQLVLPTAAGGVAGQVASKAAGKLAPHVAKYGGKAVALAERTPVLGTVVRGGRAVKEGAKKILTTELGRATLDETAARYGVKDPAGRRVAEAVSTVARTAPEAFEANQRDTLFQLAEPVFVKHGVTDPAAKGALMQDVLERWGDPTLRFAAPEPVKELIDVFQPWHRQFWEGGALKEAGVAYDPFHPLWGQDPTKAARMTETAAARAKETLGQEAWQAHPVALDESAMAEVPGLRALQGVDPASLQAHTMRPLSQIRENVVERMRQSGEMSQSQLQRLGQDFRTLTGPEAFARSARAARGDANLAMDAAAKELRASMPELMREAPERYVHIRDLEQRVMGASQTQAAGRVPLGRDVHGAIRKGDVVQQQPVEEYLRDNGLMRIRVKGVKEQTPRETWGKRHVELPEQFADLDGMVVDEYFAQAMHQVANPSMSKRKAVEIAQTLDKWLGTTQAKAAITTGNPGFHFRVNTGDMMRHVIAEGKEGVTPELRRLVADISNAPVGSTERRLLGGREYTLGELREIMQKYGDVKRTFAADIGADEAVSPGAGRIMEKILGDRGTAAYNKAVDVMSAPGRASGKLADAAFRDTFRVGGAGLNAGYSAGEGIRMLNILAQMKRGVDPRVAGNRARTLMIDFANTTALQEGLKPAVPFIKFWSQGAAGALELARRNPRRFFRLADVARYIEGYDQATEGGAMDPRTKDAVDMISMRPRFETGGGRAATLRFENPYQDVADIGEAIASTGDPTERRGVGQFLGPSAAKAAALLTGRDVATGRSVLGVDAAEAKRLGGTLPQQIMQAVRDGALTPGQAAYLLAKWVPGAPPLTGPVDLGLRVGAHLGGSTAASVPDDDVGALERAGPNWTVGVRMRRTNPQRAGLDKASSAVRELAPPMRKANITRRKAGKKEASP